MSPRNPQSTKQKEAAARAVSGGRVTMVVSVEQAKVKAFGSKLPKSTNLIILIPETMARIQRIVDN